MVSKITKPIELARCACGAYNDPRIARCPCGVVLIVRPTPEELYKFSQAVAALPTTQLEDLIRRCCGGVDTI